MAQFRRAIADGTFTWIDADLGEKLQTVYAQILGFNVAFKAMLAKQNPNEAFTTGRTIGTRQLQIKADLLRAIRALREETQGASGKGPAETQT